MNSARKHKMFKILFILSVVGITTGLVLYALGQNINLFYTPTQIAAGQAPINHPVRVGGMVEKNSIIRAKQGMEVQFKITDYGQSITVNYNGILPDLFREGQGIVAEGVVTDRLHFQALHVLAKHDANYMPPEVKSSLRIKGNA